MMSGIVTCEVWSARPPKTELGALDLVAGGEKPLLHRCTAHYPAILHLLPKVKAIFSQQYQAPPPASWSTTAIPGVNAVRLNF
jgi:hypothetical protein